jgi:hypothetical protein
MDPKIEVGGEAMVPAATTKMSVISSRSLGVNNLKRRPTSASKHLATMLPIARLGRLLPRRFSRVYSTQLKEALANDPAPTKAEVEADEMRAMQAPNREGIWSRSQKPREQAMVGPRFEQIIMKDQVKSPYLRLIGVADDVGSSRDRMLLLS